jgi:hypothetical protein
LDKLNFGFYFREMTQWTINFHFSIALQWPCSNAPNQITTDITWHRQVKYFWKAFHDSKFLVRPPSSPHYVTPFSMKDICSAATQKVTSLSCTGGFFQIFVPCIIWKHWICRIVKNGWRAQSWATNSLSETSMPRSRMFHRQGFVASVPGNVHVRHWANE